MIDRQIRMARAPRGKALTILTLLVTTLSLTVPAASPSSIAATSSAPSLPGAINPAPAVKPDATPASPAGPTNSAMLPFLSERPLADGQRELIVSPRPRRYQTESGEWDTINPRFEPVPGGFANNRNLLQIRTGERLAALRLHTAGSYLGWEPAALVLDGAAGTASIATPLDPGAGADGEVSGDGSIIRYPASWSSPDIAEEIVAGPGAVEQRLVIASRPAGDGDWLTLQAHLYLPAGATIAVGGATQSAAFTADQPVEVQDPNGRVLLVLQPPRAYEAGNPAVGAPGRYRLTPAPENGWLVNVETPWSFWAADERAYPVVLDPHMEVLRPFSTATIGQNVGIVSCNPAQVLPPGTVGVGQLPICLGVRALLRFDNITGLTLPPGAVIQKAELIAAPTYGFPNTLAGQPWFTSVEAKLYPVTGAWNPATVNWTNQPGIDGNPLPPRPGTSTGPQGGALFTVPPPSQSGQQGTPASAYTTRWQLQSGATGLVSGWLAGGANNGLELRAVNEQPCASNCGFVGIPAVSSWSQQDLVLFGNPVITQGGGFALSITYQSAALADRVPLGITDPPALPSPPGTNFNNTFHGYALPAANGSPFTVVATKGVQRTSANGQITLTVKGNMVIGGACTGTIDTGGTLCSETKSDGDFTDRSNFVLFWDNDNAAREVHIWPPNPAGAGQTSYLVEAARAENAPAFSQPETDEAGPIPGTGVLTMTVAMSSTNLVRAFNLPLTGNLRYGIKVVPQGVGRDLIDVRLFKDDRFIAKKNDAMLRNFDTTNGGNMKIFQPKANEGGNYGVVLEFFGSPTFDDCDGTPCEGSTIQDIKAQIVVRGCPLNAMPTDDGCEIMLKPTALTPHVDVGPYRVWSEAGFTAGPCSPCYTNRALGGKLYARYITWAADSNPNPTMKLVVVTQDKIFMRAGIVDPFLNGGEKSQIALGLDPPGYITQTLPLWSGNFVGFATDTPNRIRPFNFVDTKNWYNDVKLDSPDDDTFQLKIDVQNQRAEGTATINRSVETQPGTLANYSWRLNWTYDVFGYRPEGTGPLPNPTTLTPLTATPDVTIASLRLKFDPAGWTMDYDPTAASNTGRFTTIRNKGPNTRIAQPAKLGSGWKQAAAVIYQAGRLRDNDLGPAMPCNGSCVDLRGLDDTPDHLNRTFDMPDITVIDTPGTLMAAQPGTMLVFSNDHPDFKPQAANIDQSFSFRTFGAHVTVAQAVCPVSQTDSGSNGQIVTVIHGETTLALPGLGNAADPNQAIGSSFTLCESKLREVALSFHTDPGLPVGNTGLWIDGLAGMVTINPDYARIQLAIDFYVGSGAHLADGKGTFMIDTRGLFDIQAKGKLVAAVNFDGHVWVAWNPLDVGYDAAAYLPNQDDWFLSGRIHAHMWQGQGWQHKFSWLPDNGDVHIAASIGADLRIKKGQIYSYALLDLPPDDITLGVEVAFGQFCSNDTCSEYEWGIKAKLEILGYDVGLYYNLEGGICGCPADLRNLGFILGSDGYILIDQYGGGNAAPASVEEQRQRLGLRATPLINGKKTDIGRRTVANPQAATVTTPLTVTASTGSFLAGLTWVSGAPSLSLLRPDGTEITPANAVSFGVPVSATAQSILFGVKSPAAGIWQAKISNAEVADDYHFVYFANTGMPSAALTAPAATTTITAPDSTYRITWSTPPSPPGTDLRISLYYTATAAAVLTTTQQYGGVIRENLPLADGQYDWDLTPLGAGTYQVYARVYAGSAGYEPKPSTTGPGQIPGYETILAPGSIIYVDNAAPSVPNFIGLSAADQSVIACWDVNPEKDLSGYVIRYLAPDVDGLIAERFLRVNATVPYSTTMPVSQCERLGGVGTGAVILAQIAAYDSSYNLSGFTGLSASAVNDGPDFPDPPSGLTGSIGPNRTVVLNWNPGAGAARYNVYYSRNLPAGPGRSGTGAAEGTSPIALGNVTSTVIGGLTPGLLYHFRVQSVDAANQGAGLSNDVAVLVTDGVASGGGPIPGDWAAAHGVTNPNADDDLDGLTNAEEYQHWSDPKIPDTDGDGYLDGDEVTCGSNPIDRSSVPACTQPPPLLSAEPNQLTFVVNRRGLPPAGQTVVYSNTGSGVLTPTFTAGTPWITLAPSGPGQSGALTVGVNAQGLGNGHYISQVVIGGSADSHVVPRVVLVDLWVIGGPPSTRTFFPRIPFHVSGDG